MANRCDQLKGVSRAKDQAGRVYFRSGITYHAKHISLGSSYDAFEAHSMYLEAARILKSALAIEDYDPLSPLKFDKWVCLINFRENQVYFKNPIYLRSKKYFSYYLSPDLELKFDYDDLFFYSEHRIQVRGGHFFCENFGTQLSLRSRYGIRPFAVVDRDFRFVNKDDTDYRYENIEIINRYNGVERKQARFGYVYKAKIHVNGDFVLGTYATEEEAAIAYNKALDLLRSRGLKKDAGLKNYIEDMSGKEYADIYENIKLSLNFLMIL